jgi:hypothetical protein
MPPLQIALLVGIVAILGLNVYRIFIQAPPTSPRANLSVQIPAVSDHVSEVALLAGIAIGCIVLLWKAIDVGKLDGLDVGAFLLVLQRVIEAVTARWTGRTLDRFGANLANSPPADPPAPAPAGDPPPAPAAAE